MKTLILATLSALAITLAACSSRSGQSSATSSPTGNPSAPTTEPGGPDGSARTITRADNCTALHLAPGDRFLLQLGEDFDWSAEVADQSVVSRVIGIAVIRGAQGVYEATGRGTTTLTAIGDPLCRKAQPPCATLSVRFVLTITVP